MSVDASNVIIDVVETKVDSFMDKIKDTIENIHDAIPGISFSPEICNALKLLVAENPEVFSSMENTLNAIIADDKIDSRDVPHLLLLVKKVYDLARNRKDVLQKVDVYDMVKGVLRLLIVIFMKRNSKNTAVPQTAKRHPSPRLPLLFSLFSFIDMSWLQACCF